MGFIAGYLLAGGDIVAPGPVLVAQSTGDAVQFEVGKTLVQGRGSVVSGICGKGHLAVGDVLGLATIDVWNRKVNGLDWGFNNTNHQKHLQTHSGTIPAHCPVSSQVIRGSPMIL